jgi:phosphatidylserine/phosphatidylglycerophosphate/cardiolipin synthase-like enzyme
MRGIVAVCGRTGLGLLAIAAAAVLFYMYDIGWTRREAVEGLQPEQTESRSISAYFTPDSGGPGDSEPGPTEQAILADLAAAQHTIDVATYDLDLWRLRDALLDGQRRGISVRLVVEADHERRPQVLDLMAADIPIVADDRPPLMHHKFIVVDGQLVWTGSMNLTHRGIYTNNNNFIRIRSTDVAADFTREFDEMFLEDRFGALSRMDTPFPYLAVADSAIEVAFSPEDGVERRILNRLGQASTSVDFMAFSLTSDPIAEALLQAANRGIEIRGVVEAARAHDLGADVGELRAAGLDIRLDTNPGNMHNKVMVIDRRVVVTGSYNFTQSAEEHNDENLLIIDNPALAGQYVRMFDQLYAAALP